jgi:phospholipid transport system substrate-binding protein
MGRSVGHHQACLTEQTFHYVDRPDRFQALPFAAPHPIHFVTRPHRARWPGMIRRTFLLAIPVACLLSPLKLAAQGSGPEAAIAALNEALLKVMHAGRATPFAQRAEMLRPVVEQTFDLPLLLRNSVGNLRWPGLPDAQKAQLLDLFEQFTIDSYVANFDAFNGEKFVIMPDIHKVENDMVVPTRLIAANGDVTRLDYVLRQTDDQWRIVDILLDGTISRVAVTRSDYRALLAPGDASKLIESLRGKVANLTAGNAS